MNVLGISGRDRDAAAALAINGRLVAAVSEESLARGTRFRSSRAFPRNAMRACLTIAGVEASEIQEVAIVQDHTEAAHASPQGPDPSLRHARVRAVDPAFADAAQAAGTTGGAAVVLVWTTEPPAIAAYAREPGGLRLHQHAAGAEALFGAVGRIA